MALSHDWIINSASFLWILTLFIGNSHSKRTQTYYMDGLDCGKTLDLGGAVVFSHHLYMTHDYNHSITCTLRFQAQNRGWKLMMRILELDIPDRQFNGLCNDALWVYNAESIYNTEMVMEEAGGNYGLCGHKLPSTLYSTGKYLTLHFRTDKRGKRGKGFKFVITAFSEDYNTHNSCGSSFLCDNHWCIDEDLRCDRVDHCGDYSDEVSCGNDEVTFLEKFLSMGIAALVAIVVGGLIVFIVCVAAVVCCCRRCFCKREQASSTGATTMLTPTSAVANGNPGMVHGNGHAQQDRGMNLQHHAMSPFSNPTHQGYFPMQPVYPSPHGSVQGSVYSGYTRDSGFTHNHFGGGHTSSVYSSQAPSYHGHRSHTPTSSKSGKSHHSNNSVKYSHSNDKVMMPVNL